MDYTLKNIHESTYEQQFVIKLDDIKSVFKEMGAGKVFGRVN